MEVPRVSGADSGVWMGSRLGGAKDQDPQVWVCMFSSLSAPHLGALLGLQPAPEPGVSGLQGCLLNVLDLHELWPAAKVAAHQLLGRGMVEA